MKNESPFEIIEIDIRQDDFHDRKGEPFRHNTKVHISEENNPNAKPIVELITGFRYNRDYNAYRKFLMPEVLKKLGLPADTKVSWKQRCGCSCPCSPGFVVDSYRCMTVWVKVKVKVPPQQMELPVVS